MKILFLDDNLERHKKFRQTSIGCTVDFAADADTILDFLKSDPIEYNMIFLDHDLAAEHENKILADVKDGRYVVKQMIEMGLHELISSTLIVIHSLNQVGSKEMENLLTEAGFTEVHRVPFAWSRFKMKGDQVSFPQLKENHMIAGEIDRLDAEENDDTE